MSRQSRVNQDNSRVNTCSVLAGLISEARGREEDALSGPLPIQRPHKSLYLIAANGLVGPPLGLNVDAIEATLILVDDAVHALISAWSNSTSGVIST